MDATVETKDGERKLRQAWNKSERKSCEGNHFFFKELSGSCKMWDLEGPNGMMALEKAKTEFANVKLLQLLIRHA